MRRAARFLAGPLLLATLALLPFAPAAAGKAPPKKSPHVQVAGVAVVASHPKKVTHRNQREFLEFWIRFREVAKVPDARSGDDPGISVATDRDVKVFHDLTCGGAALKLEKGDVVEVKGEYVHPPDGKDLLHFTHPADGSCGTKGGHADGYLRRKG